MHACSAAKPACSAGTQGMVCSELGLYSVLPKRAGPLLCALTHTLGHAASGALGLTGMLAHRWHGVAQPRRAARA